MKPAPLLWRNVCFRLMRVPPMLLIRKEPWNCRVPDVYVAYRRSARWSPSAVEHVRRNVRSATSPQPRSWTEKDGEYEVHGPVPTCACALDAASIKPPPTAIACSLFDIFI